MTASIGWVSDRFGRRPVFLWAIVGYTITLVGCGASTTLEQEVAWRFVQGVFGAALLPLGQIIAVNAFPKERYVQATALWALGFVSANVFAPAVAGIIVEEFGWPWIFYLPIPVSVAVLAASWVLVPDAPKNVRPMPWTGFLGLIIGVSFLQLMLARGERLDWFESTEIVLEAGSCDRRALHLHRALRRVAPALLQPPALHQPGFRDRTGVLVRGGRGDVPARAPAAAHAPAGRRLFRRRHRLPHAVPGRRLDARTHRGEHHPRSRRPAPDPALRTHDQRLRHLVHVAVDG